MKGTPKGMRDFLPEDMILRESVIETIKGVYRKYGFVPIETPAIEYLDTLKAKSGEEIKKEIFVIEGGEYGLRFDLTVPLARVAANNAFTKPFKRYCISRVWRHEEPQKGRFREFWQCDVDVVGSESTRADAEVIKCTIDAIEKLGFNKPKILLNNRKIMNGLAQKLNVKEKVDDLLRILDKIDKIGEDQVKKHLKEHFDDQTIKRVFELLKTTGTNQQKLKAATVLSEEGAKELEQIIELLPNAEIVVDLSLVRGLGYYTGPVFEAKLSDEIGSVAGGGRYDTLLAMYGQSDYATGMSIGLERILFLLNKKKTETQKTLTQVFVACVKPEFYSEAEKIASELRKQGIATETDLNARNLRKQLEYVNSMGILYTLVIGQNEIKTKKAKLRNMKTGEEKDITLGERIILGEIK